MGRRARQAMQTSHGVERAAAFVRQRFEKIQHGRSTAIVPDRAFRSKHRQTPGRYLRVCSTQTLDRPPYWSPSSRAA